MDTSNVSFIIVTGLSGAGKTQAMKALEDLEYFCIDNLPPLLLPRLIEINTARQQETRKFAIAMDVRGKEHFADLSQAVEWLDNSGTSYQIIFLDCKDSILVRRFSETRRRHPLIEQGSIYDSIRYERTLLAEVRELADVIVDTSAFKPVELKTHLNSVLTGKPIHQLLTLDIISFGYKYGVPNDGDIVFDIRFLPNPFYIEEMKRLTGKDQAVSDYVMKWPQTKEFLDRFYGLLVSLIPAYSEEGKARLTVGIGCTGGQHRSVAISIELGRRLSQDGIINRVRHRDCDAVSSPHT